MAQYREHSGDTRRQNAQQQAVQSMVLPEFRGAGPPLPEFQQMEQGLLILQAPDHEAGAAVHRLIEAAQLTGDRITGAVLPDLLHPQDLLSGGGQNRGTGHLPQALLHPDDPLGPVKR